MLDIVKYAEKAFGLDYADIAFLVSLFTELGDLIFEFSVQTEDKMKSLIIKMVN